MSETDAFSSNSVSITIQIEPVNDAPLLSNETFDLTAILEDDIDSIGDDVGDVIFGRVTDVDRFDTSFGIAVVLADEENGEWQVSTNAGRTWTAMTDVCPYNATLLYSTPFGQNRVRFVPDRDFNGYANFSYLAWDLTSGEPSGTMGVDTTISDQITGAFSITMATARIFVEPVNDSPVLSAGSMLFTIFEDVPTLENNGTAVSDIVIDSYIDVDENSRTGVAVVGVDLRFGVWEYRCLGFPDWEEFIGDLQYGVIVPPTPGPREPLYWAETAAFASSPL